MYDNKNLYNVTYDHSTCMGEPVNTCALEAVPSLHKIVNSCFSMALQINELSSIIENKLIGMNNTTGENGNRPEPTSLEAKLLVLDNILLNTESLLNRLNERI